jgi:inner membrane protein
MDPITHGLIGANIAKTTVKQTTNASILWLGIIAATAPDLDVVISNPHIPTLILTYHRNFTHSLLFAPFAGIFLALLWIFIFKEKKQEWPKIFFISIVGFFSHGLLDSATSYGTLLFWPFSWVRVTWDYISIVDPIFTCILIGGIAFSIKKFGAKPAFISLFLAFSYLCFGVYQHHRAMLAQKMLVDSRNQVIEKRRVMPELAQLFNYRSFYISQKIIHVDAIQTPLFASATFIHGVKFPQFTESDLPEYIRDSASVLKKDFDIFNWFSDGLLTTISTNPLILTDLRFVSRFRPLKDRWSLYFPNNPQLHAQWVKSRST